MHGMLNVTYRRCLGSSYGKTILVTEVLVAAQTATTENHWLQGQLLNENPQLSIHNPQHESDFNNLT